MIFIFSIQGGWRHEDEGRKRNDEDHPRRSGGGGGHDRDRYSGGPPRRDYDSNRTNKYNPSEKGTKSKKLHFCRNRLSIR